MKSANRAFTLIEIMIVVLIIGILLAIAVPNFIRAREQSRAKSCSANLKQIDAAKEQYAMDAKKSAGDAVALADIAGTDKYIKSTPSCPSTGLSTTYTVGNVSVDPICATNDTTKAKGFYHTVNGLDVTGAVAAP